MNPQPPERSARFLDYLQPMQRELENYARKMLWEPQEAEDALHNAVLRAFRAFDRYREDASFRGWMYRILTNEIHTLNRRHSRRAKFEFQLAPEEIAALARADEKAPDADGMKWPDAVDQRLTLALQALPDKERSVLVLRGISGLAYQEIAVALEMPLGNVMGYLSRARTKMRAALAGTEMERRRQP